MEKILLQTNRTGYTPSQCGRTLTVGELIRILEDYDEETPIYFSNDDGYTYGNLDYDTVQEYESDEDDE